VTTAEATRNAALTPCGVLVVRKPRGPTSHDIVAQVRRYFRTREVGHAGTLDPMASGVLVLMLGEATKLASYLTLEDKAYRATVAFGSSTDTLDAEGTVVAERDVDAAEVADTAVALALSAEAARTEQVPPAFSAISVGGKRAHRLARKGEAPVLAPRPVQVAALSLLSRTPRAVTVELEVSKGYYVRSFARDLGERLGVPSHLAALERLRSGPYRIEEAISWPPAAIPALVPLPEAARRVLPFVELSADGVARARVGKRLSAEHFLGPAPDAPHAAWFDGNGVLVALGEPDSEGAYRVTRGFRAPDPGGSPDPSEPK
jgi:tRNA pseudouridine55 synthase